MNVKFTTISPGQATSEILKLFNITKPTMPRAFNVLQGLNRGQILVDNPMHPTTAVVRDLIYGTLYLGGDVSAPLPASLVRHFRQMIEVGVATAEASRRQGLATIACARLIEMCEEKGYKTWWDCAGQYTPSVKLARRLGYQGEPEFRYVWWQNTNCSNAVCRTGQVNCYISLNTPGEKVIFYLLLTSGR